MLTLTLIRGLPGSGKSTKAASLKKSTGADWFEADMFFDTINGYQWNRDLLHQAHQWCQLNTLQSLYAGRSVIVSNTFTTIKEMQPYLDILNTANSSEKYPRLRIIEMRTQYESIHNVPKETLQKMSSRWQEIPSTALAPFLATKETIS